MTDPVQAQLEAVLRGIEERTPHDKECAEGKRQFHGGIGVCDCDDRPARVRAEQARMIAPLLEAATYGKIAQEHHTGSHECACVCNDCQTLARLETTLDTWAAALRAGEETT